MEQLKQINGIEKAVAEMVEDLEAKKDGIKDSLAPYINGVVTEDTLDAWKKDRATLNKSRTAYETERKGIEAGWKDNLKPLISVYSGIKAAYTEAIDNIDRQTKEFEEKRIAEKKEAIKVLFESVPVPEEIAGWLSLEDVYNPKWENKTTKDKDITSEIEKTYMDIVANVTTIKLMNSKYEDDGINVLKETGDLNKALVRINELAFQEQRVKDELERQKREAEERERLKELDKIIESEKKAKEQIENIKNDFLFGEPQTAERNRYMMTIVTEADMTPDELEDLTMTLNRLGLKVKSSEVIG